MTWPPLSTPSTPHTFGKTAGHAGGNCSAPLRTPLERGWTRPAKTPHISAPAADSAGALLRVPILVYGPCMGMYTQVWAGYGLGVGIEFGGLLGQCRGPRLRQFGGDAVGIGGAGGDDGAERDMARHLRPQCGAYRVDGRVKRVGGFAADVVRLPRHAFG